MREEGGSPPSLAAEASRPGPKPLCVLHTQQVVLLSALLGIPNQSCSHLSFTPPFCMHTQQVVLLSSLGIPDEVFIAKQAQYLLEVRVVHYRKAPGPPS